MSYHDSRSSSAGGGTDTLGEVALMIGLLLLITVLAPALLIGLFGYRLFERWSTHPRRDWSIVVGIALVCLSIGYHFFWPLNQPGSPLLILVADFGRGLHHNFQWNGWQLLHDLLPVWAMGLLLGPAAICGFGLFEQTRPKSPRQIALLQAQQKHAAVRRSNDAATRQLARRAIPDTVKAGKNGAVAIVLGIPLEDGSLNWIWNDLFCLPLEELANHGTVIGKTNSGKSETLVRIAGAAKALGWQVVYVDAKGDYKLMAKFQLAMEAAGAKQVRLFPLERYNGWVGTRDALLSRLLSIDNVAEVTNQGQQHYKNVADNLLEMAINAPGGPPRTSEELLDRLLVTNGIMYDLYAGYSKQQHYLEHINEQEALSAYGRYRAFFSKTHGLLDGTWSYDSCEAAYLLLDGLAQPEIAIQLGRFLLADFVNYAARKSWDQPTLFIFDEIGALSLPIFGVFEKVRFRNVAVMVSSQDPSGLAHRPGAWDEAKRVLGNSAIKIVHRSEDAYEVIRRAGTDRVPDQDYRTDAAGMTTGGGTTRFREQLKIDPNEVLKLKRGEVFVLGPGDYRRVRVAMRTLDQARFERLYQAFEHQAKEEPPPRPRRSGGEKIVDSTLVSPPAGSTPSSRAGQPAQQKRTNGAQPATPPQKQGTQLASSGQSKANTPVAKPAQPAKRSAQQPRQPAAPPEPAGNNVKAPHPLALPEAGQQVPTQPGVLPMWGTPAEETEADEDLLR